MPALTARPSERHPDIRREACKAILSDVKEWCGSRPRREQQILDDLTECADGDKYTFARNLERLWRWDPDGDLIDILENYDTYNALKDATEIWVKYHDIRVPHQVGDIVVLRGEDARIVDIRPKTAQIVAQPLQDDGISYGEKGGWVHGFEDVRLTSPQPSEIQEIDQLRAFKAAVYAAAGPRPSETPEQPVWMVDLFEVEATLAQARDKDLRRRA